MNIIFLTLHSINSLSERGIYTDLLRKFQQEGNTIHIVRPTERRDKGNTEFIKLEELNLLKVRTLNIQKTNLLEKGLATLAIEYQFLYAIKKYLSTTKFDLVLYSTPPITMSKVIKYLKTRDGAYSYLLLKDIFPQNAVDMKMLRKNGVIHKYFLQKEKKLYQLSDKIGCLSQANFEYLKRANTYLDINKVEVNPNTISPVYIDCSDSDRRDIKLKYSIPLKKKIFIYGGNLGKPQGLEFLLKTIQETKRTDVFFLIVGSGTEFNNLREWFDQWHPSNAVLMAGLPKNDYDKLLRACDVGLIFLSKNFTIPNYPSRLLSYLEMKIPIIAATDAYTDVGSDIERNGCGFSVISGDSRKMQDAIDATMDIILSSNTMKESTWLFLQREFKVERSYELITKSIYENEL